MSVRRRAVVRKSRFEELLRYDGPLVHVAGQPREDAFTAMDAVVGLATSQRSFDAHSKHTVAVVELQAAMRERMLASGERAQVQSVVLKGEGAGGGDVTYRVSATRSRGSGGEGAWAWKVAVVGPTGHTLPVEVLTEGAVRGRA